MTDKYLISLNNQEELSGVLEQEDKVADRLEKPRSLRSRIIRVGPPAAPGLLQSMNKKTARKVEAYKAEMHKFQDLIDQ